MRDGDELLTLADGGKGRLDGEHAVLAQGRLDGLRVRALGQQELTVVLPVHGLRVGLLLVLGVDLRNKDTNGLVS